MVEPAAKGRPIRLVLDPYKKNGLVQGIYPTPTRRTSSDGMTEPSWHPGFYQVRLEA